MSCSITTENLARNRLETGGTTTARKDTESCWMLGFGVYEDIKGIP